MHWAAWRELIWRLQWPLILLCGLLLLAISEWTQLDWLVQDWIYDEKVHGFPLRDHWLLQDVLHTWVKRVVILVWLALLVIRIRWRDSKWLGACRILGQHCNHDCLAETSYWQVLPLGSGALRWR